MRTRVLVSAAAAVSLLAAAPPVAPSEPAGPLDTAADFAAAVAFEERILDHLHYGQVHEQYYNTDEKVPGDIQIIVGESDSALYTGNYLAGEAFRFGVAQDRLADLNAQLAAAQPKKPNPGKALGHAKKGLSDEELAALEAEIAVWQDQLAEAKSRVDTVANQFHILTNVSQNWYGNPDLRFGGKSVTSDSCDAEWSGGSNPDPTESECDEELAVELANDVQQGEYQRQGYVDHGGGVITGGSTPVNEPQPGLLFRYCSDSDAPYAFNAGRNPRNDRLAANLAWDNNGDGVIEDGEAQNCIGGTSRDAYAGVTFGLATALDLVGPSDPALATQIANDIMVMTDYAFRYYWTQPRSHGRMVIPAVFGGNNLESSYQPDMFVQVPLHRLNMVQIAKHAATVVGAADKLATYDAMWAEEIATQLPLLAGEMQVDAVEPHSGYYKFHLHHMTAFNVIRLETDPILRAEFMRGFGVLDNETRTHDNALYEAITFAMTGEQARLDDAVVHHRQWLDYYATNQASNHISNNSARCDIDFACVADASKPVTFDAAGNEVEADYGVYNQVLADGEAAVTGQPPKPGKLRAAQPLPVALRISADFMWQKDPTNLDGGHYSARYSAPGADFLLPYWMIRYYSEVDVPALTPFDAPPTPDFR